MAFVGLPDGAEMERLGAYFKGLGSVLVCYSGGVDSAFVLAVAHRVLGDKAVGMTAVSPSLASFEKEAAVALAERIGARYELVDSNELARPSYVANGIDRCFHCKSELYDIAEAKRSLWGLTHIVNGTNLDDLGDHRPGLEAAKAARVKSPLIDCGFGKAEVRKWAKELDLAVWDKPAAACLASRLPFGTEVTRERLAQVGGFEAELHALGFRQLRVRLHVLEGTAGTTAAAMARIELGAGEIARAVELREQMTAAGKRFGFAYVTLDLGGYRMGSHNEVLRGNQLRVL